MDILGALLAAAERFFGMSLADGIGVGGLDLIHPDDLQIALLALTTVQDKEVGTPLEIRLAAHDGWRLAEVIGAPLGDDLILAIRDLTERRRWEVAHDEDARGEERQVLLPRGLEDQRADPLVVEEVLDRDEPAEEVADLNGDYGDRRRQRVPEHVLPHDDRVRQPLEVGGARVVAVERLDHRRHCLRLVALRLLARSCIEPHAVRTDLERLVWDKPRACSEQSADFPVGRAWSAPNLVRRMCALNQDLVSSARSEEAALVFIARGKAGCRVISWQSIHDCLAEFLHRHALASFHLSDLRRAGAKLHHVAGRSIRAAKMRLNHADVGTTQRYTSAADLQAQHDHTILRFQGVLLRESRGSLNSM